MKREYTTLVPDETVSLPRQEVRGGDLRTWNEAVENSPQPVCIHQLIEEQVRHSPDEVAVVFEGKSLTYQELDQRSNQLAHLLQQQGVGQEVLVGICLERSLEMVVALLGILKAGGAYVPLDPAYPADRIQYVLEDSRVQVLITQETLLPSLPHTDARIVVLDS